MKLNLTISLLLLALIAFAQQKTQIIRGKVFDKDTRLPLIGVNIVLKNITPTLGTTSDEYGKFTIANVPLGRQTILSSYVGYEPYQSEDMIVSSAKEIELEIALKEGNQLNSVEITAFQATNAPINEFSFVSARSFSVEETERIPTSVNDPSRMAMSFAGVQQGGDDTENDIIVRGNSPFGMLWRLEGIDIPNPNHFARPGTSGGGITIFSAQLMGSSDFSTGAMPAEYGNALSGVFDIRFRQGNKLQQEHRVKLGLLGLDFATEGPLKKGKSSYLINYRYSTLSLLNTLGFHFNGEYVNNGFQDLSFNIVNEGKDGKSHFTIFGLGGLSRQENLARPVALRRNDVGSDKEHKVWDTTTGVLGATYSKTLSEKAFFKAVFAAMTGEITRLYDTLDNQDIPFRYNDELYLDKRLSTALSYNYKYNAQTRLKAGLIFNQIFFDFYKETTPTRLTGGATEFLKDVSVTGKGNTQQIQTYVQVNHQLNEKLSINGGLHFLHLFLNNTNALEPRLAFKYALNQRQSLSLAYGLHSKILPLYAYFYTQKEGNSLIQPNKELPLAKAHHVVASYNYQTKNSIRFNIEAYYQKLYNIAIRPINGSVYWMLNEQAVFPQEKLVSDGTGQNIGLDVLIEKFFSNKFYFILTNSIYDATYKTFDKKVYPSSFAQRFASALTIGKEFIFKNTSIFQIGARAIVNGGMRYTPIDLQSSIAQDRYVNIDSRYNELQVEPYRRLDMRFAYRFNKKHYAGLVSLDIQNVTNYRNIGSIVFDTSKYNVYFNRWNAGFTPILAFQVDF